MWEWFRKYPSTRIESIGTPYAKGLDLEDVVEYDYIIVGGGTAGCVIANRLSANPAVKVLLVERGNINDSFFASCVLLTHPPFGLIPAKGIKIVPQKALSNREDFAYESLSLGGRTRINAALYLPGCPAEYESWPKGWQWDDVAPFFMLSEGRIELENQKRPASSPDHEGGEWKTRVVKAQYESSREFAKALGRLGVPEIEAFVDPNTPTCFGMYQRRSINAAGRRCSTYHAFLPKSLVKRRKNLTIVLGGHVQQILFSNSPDRLRATGLLIEGRDGRFFTVRARFEIIICGGAIVSPQLLLLSGVGPKEHLTEVGKPCIHDLPGVGSTLQDHVYVPISFFIPAKDSVHQLIQNPVRAIISLFQFFLFGTGLFLSIISEYFCYAHSNRLPPQHDKSSRALPDLELFWTASYGAVTYPEFPKGKGAGSVLIQNSLPKSVGSVRLAPSGANDIKVDPIVDPNHLSAPEDWETYRRGITFAREIGKEMARGGYPIEEAMVPKSNARKDLDEYISKTAMGAQHVLSSCRMKPLEEGGVVDPELRVYGIDGLRIADGSIIPGMVASRPQATVVMIAERCADFIRKGWKEKKMFNYEK